ncbi:c-type cytochrome [Novosphingobium sp. FSY-8]|uniref:C-type cytochrome n=1 Tax=Novosphingobium ovatum TaxID=1908523 RepID=A0ABW9X940_9SPHN|nr:c-type cytochrome [Novosphingobium ovatum]NBC35030.1 c-type cytochrome [Novosphingobium ovatum]
MIKTICRMGLGLGLTLAAVPAMAGGDAAAGARSFSMKCGVCHTTNGDKLKIGPTMAGIMGRKAGTVAATTTLSDALLNGGITWDQDIMRRFLANPRQALPGNKMAFTGIKDPQELDNLVAYLMTLK